MINSYRAFNYLGNMPTGRTQPVLLRCEAVDDAGDIRDFVVKAPGLPEVTDYELFVETAAYLLARELGVETPLAAVIQIDRAFVDTVNPFLKKSGFPTIKPGLGFGSQLIVAAVPMTGAESLDAEQRSQALGIFCFDLLVQNPDRVPERPNCMMSRGKLVAFDFNSAMSFIPLVGVRTEPWKFSEHQIHGKHLLYRALYGKDVDFGPFINRLRKLSDDRINQILEVVPFGNGTWDEKVKEHFASVRENIAKLSVELVRCVR